jgi:hypothetical protein
VVIPVGHEGPTHCVPAAWSWQSPAPSQKPVIPQVAAPSAAHCPLGSIPPAGIGLHIPSVPTSPHEVQLAVQAVPQQMPAEQNPLWQSPGSAQLAPSGRRPHEPFSQTLGGAQSTSEAQVDLQAAAPHRYGKQVLMGGVTQAPAPSQAEAGVSVMPPAGQLAAPHDVPWAYSWQAPASHFPLVSQVPDRSTQVWEGSGLLVGTLVQAPIDPDSAHDLQALAQAVAQQTPCAQLSDAHSVLSEQNAPFGFLPQELPTHTLPGAQLTSTAQLPKHLLPLQA